MKFKEYKFFVGSDLYRYEGKLSLKTFLYHYFLTPEFKYTFWMRTCYYLYDKKIFTVLLFISKLMLRYYSYKFGISIPFKTMIGSGFYIGHFGGIVVNENSIIGKNCNISHQVTLGKANRGSKKGYPVIGNNVYIGPGAKIVGAVKIEDYVAIGANCVVTKDVPEKSVVVGIPGKVISNDGSTGYINNIDYEHLK